MSRTCNSLFPQILLLLIPGVLQAQDSAPQDSLQSSGRVDHAQLEFKKWSGGINVPDPVAISVDDLGRVYVTQTKRRKTQDLDIRQHSEWIPNDLSLQSVDDKRAFYRKVLAIDGDQQVQAKHVADFNGDGNHDWRDLTVLSETIYRLVDTDADGTADQITTFAEEFNTEVTGIAAGVLAHAGEVYATVAPDVWKLHDPDQDGHVDDRESIAHGFGLHIAYGGHDMHGLTLGPDGKIYWSIGDKGIHVETETGETFAYPHEGGVMRCNPDGSDFEVFAHGLRNVQELAFDQYGNLFGVDNDSDRPNEKERFVYIVDQMDAGWRCYYQYRQDEYNPWTDEKLWELAGDHHPAYIVPPISHYVDGPAGFVFNPGTALSPDYHNYFFLTGAPNGSQFAFRAEYDDDQFKMVDAHQIGEGIAIVGLAFGPDGALYGADWDGGYPLDEKGSVIRIDVSANDHHAARGEVQRQLAVGFRDHTQSELVSLLAHVDQRLRLGAQFELVRRGKTDILAGVALDDDSSLLARLHAAWGLGQLGRQGDLLGRDSLGLLMRDDEAILRAQAAKTYGELHAVSADPLIRLLKDNDVHVRSLSALALARHPSPAAVGALWEQIDKLEATQHYWRHGLVTAFSRCATADELGKAVDEKLELRRLCAVLALRKQRSEVVGAFLGDESDWVADAAARAIHDEQSIPGALVTLAESLNTRPKQTESYCRRAINANRRLGDPESANRLLRFAQDNQRSQHQRSIALQALLDWQQPNVLDAVEGIWRKLELEHREIELSELQAALPKLLSSDESQLRRDAIKLFQNYDLELPQQTLEQLLRNVEFEEATRVMALEALWSAIDDGWEIAFASDSDALKKRAMQLASEGEQSSSDRLIEVLSSSTHSIPVQQEAIRLLALDGGDDARMAIETRAGQLLADELPLALALDVCLAVELLAEEHSKFAELHAQLTAQASAAFPDDNPVKKLGGFQSAPMLRYAVQGGDASLGEKLFTTHQEAQCSRCHRLGTEGSEIGPELTHIAKTRDAEHLLRSIVSPSADIEDKYQSEQFLLYSGQVVKGVVQARNEEVITIADSQGKLLEILLDDVEQSSVQSVSLMPAMHEVLTPRQFRDLAAFLQTLK